MSIEAKAQTAIERIRAHQRVGLMGPEPFYVADSGGKDSCVVLDLVKRADVAFDAHHNVTTVDPPEVRIFLRRFHPETQFHMPPLTMFQLIEKKLYPPSQRGNVKRRYCCEWLKERGGKGRIVIQGIRWEESEQRSHRRIFEPCGKSSAQRLFLNPIIDWTTDEVWEYIRRAGLPYCSLYDEGWARVGCVMCPMADKSKRWREFGRWPGIALQYHRACVAAYARMISKGRKPRSWRSGTDMFWWWLFLQDGVEGKHGYERDPALSDLEEW